MAEMGGSVLPIGCDQRGSVSATCALTSRICSGVRLRAKGGISLRPSLTMRMTAARSVEAASEGPPPWPPSPLSPWHAAQVDANSPRPFVRSAAFVVGGAWAVDVFAGPTGPI